jgi:glyoxylate utilization-related uncharacterized protein
MANIVINQILIKRGNTSASSTYTGPLGELIFDTGLKTLRLQDGATAGGTSILATNTQVWALSNSISTLSGINATFSANITALSANAATQQTQINSVTAELHSFETYANATFTVGGVGTYGNSNVAAYLPTSSIITGINSNVTAANTHIHSGCQCWQFL